MTLAQDAQRFAEAGFPVFPLRPRSKQPLTPNGFKNASKDLDQVIKWWRENPQANIGLPTGRATGLAVVDIDHPDRWETMRSLFALHVMAWPPPGCPIVRTPRGGWHVYFRSCGSEIRNRTGIQSLGDHGHKLDVRGEGGYVVIPASICNNGDYRWHPGGDITVRTPKPLPRWLKRIFYPPKVSTAVVRKLKIFKKVTTPVDTKSRLIRRATLYAATVSGQIESSPSRNKTIFKTAGHLFAMREKSSGLSLTEADVCRILQVVNETFLPPLEVDEVNRAVRSALTNGEPRPPKW